MRRIFHGRRGALESFPGAFWLRHFLALFVLHIVLLLPAWPDGITSTAFLRLPFELPLLILLLAVAPERIAGAVRTVAIVILSVLTIVKIANLVAFFGFARPFNILVDPFLIPIALETLLMTSVAAAAAAVVAVLLLIALVVLAFVVVTGVLTRADEHRIDVIAAGVVLLVIGAALSVFPSTTSYAGFDASRFARDQVRSVTEGLAAAAQFRRDMAEDAFAAVPDTRLLADLKNTDVILIFIEAYGRTVFDDPEHAAVPALLARWEGPLSEAGFTVRSAWMTSPTFGGQSWLAHSTFVSGLSISDQRRYDSLFLSNRQTLVGDFRRAGWRSIAMMPVITRAWPEASFFGYDKFYGAGDLGYAGPPFGYITMPDQFALSAFHRLEMTPAPRPPVFAEIALISSHLPWAPRPRFVPWDQVGDGAVFSSAREGSEAEVNWLDPDGLRQDYVRSIEYVLETTFSYVLNHIKDDAIVIVLGDHQPVPLISGTSAPHDVPIHIMSRNPARLEALAPGWTVGLRPDPTSQPWPMEGMRGHILKAFTPAETPPP